MILMGISLKNIIIMILNKLILNLIFVELDIFKEKIN